MKISTAALFKTILTATAFVCLAACAPPHTSGGGAVSGIVAADEVLAPTSTVGRSTVLIISTSKTAAGILVVETCTGSIIAQNMVVTAAHCLVNRDAANVFVHFGAYHDGDSLSDNLSIHAVQLVTHPNFSLQWKAGDDGFDIGLVKVSANLASGYVPAKILPPTFSLSNGKNVYVAGAGNPQFTGDFSDEILRGYASYLVDGRSAPYGTMISLKSPAAGGIMDGDSGGPALVKLGDDLLLWGVASSSTGTSGGHAYYTDIRRFQTWIAQSAK